jgi:hypothetical protein
MEPSMSAVRFPARKLVLFAMLSCADFALTWQLLHDGAGEGNPLAAWSLARGGWLGLAAFKAAAVLTAVGLSVFLFRLRPLVGHRVLAFGCVALLAVVLYSGYLAAGVHGVAAGPGAPEMASLRSETDRLIAATQRARAYREVLDEVLADLRAGRCTLEAGVGRLAATDCARDPKAMRGLRTYYPGRSDRECLAIGLLNHIAADGAGGTVSDRQLTGDLAAEFIALYGRPAPRTRGERA